MDISGVIGTEIYLFLYVVVTLELGSGYINNHCQIMCSEYIKIGNHVCIGQRAMILKGVTIGRSAISAVGSIVTEDIPVNILVAGIPKKLLKEKFIWK